MKTFIGLVLGVIAIGLLIVGAAIALVLPARTDVEVMPIEDMGISNFNAYPSSERLGIQISWTAANPETTIYVLERSMTADYDAWNEVVTIEPGSDEYVDRNSVEYVDEDVEHMATYFYRVQMADSDGGSGLSEVIAATAVDPPG